MSLVWTQRHTEKFEGSPRSSGLTWLRRHIRVKSADDRTFVHPVLTWKHETTIFSECESVKYNTWTKIWFKFVKVYESDLREFQSFPPDTEKGPRPRRENPEEPETPEAELHTSVIYIITFYLLRKICCYHSGKSQILRVTDSGPLQSSPEHSSLTKLLNLPLIKMFNNFWQDKTRHRRQNLDSGPSTELKHRLTVEC